MENISLLLLKDEFERLLLLFELLLLILKGLLNVAVCFEAFELLLKLKLLFGYKLE